jgi:hypothetical protein
MIRSLFLTLVVSMPVVAQEQFPGPIADAVEQRINKLFEGFEARVEARQAGRINELLDNIKEFRAERDGLFQHIKELREQNGTFIERIQELRAENGTILSRIATMRSELSDAVGKWTPIQDAIDRLMGLVWKLFLLICLVGGLLLLVSLIVAVSYARLKAFFVNALDL